MESVFCECKECGALIGRFTNLWTQIGKDLFSPVLEPEGDLAIHCQGHDRNCTAVLGLKCIHTPVNHLLGGGQILLRLASVGLLDSDGHGSEFAIKRILIDEPTMGSNAKVAEPSQGALADRLASATATLGELGQQFAALRTLIHGELCEFESKLRSQYQEMQGLKSDINGSLPATEDAEDMASFRAEMAKMRRQIDEICSRSMGRTEVLPSGELEVLTSNKTGGKADQPTIDQVIRIPKDLQARLLDMEEPERYGTWLRCVFEEDPEVQIDQLALWRAYSASFLGALTRAGRPIISAPEFIQRISAVWPNARPQVIQSGPNREEQKYIRGPGQPVKCGFWSLTAEKMWEHVLSKHVNVTGTKEGVHRTREIEASQRGLDSLEKQIVKREKGPGAFYAC
ncbi:uncharacterized protein B0T15DRAFT_507784 [Chaetomium strumarium]|uniref:Uncharacterized protein n=1 Tax=Chaetomium strumarium TaxID=1170767 RepID=A0AAJ0H3K9_9PEZI|nr:hypothetical protein B0T15DRAFT_507784 [Chaetomium strumarium]